MSRITVVLIVALLVAFGTPMAFSQDQENPKGEKQPKPGKRPAQVAPEKAKRNADQPGIAKKLALRLERQAKALKALTEEVKRLKQEMSAMKKALGRSVRNPDPRGNRPGAGDDKPFAGKKMKRRARTGQDGPDAPDSAKKRKGALRGKKGTPEAPKGARKAPKGARKAPKGARKAPKGALKAPKGARKAPAGKADRQKRRAAGPDRAQRRGQNQFNLRDKSRLHTKGAPAKKGRAGTPDRAARLRALKKRLEHHPELKKRLRERIIERRR